MKVFPIESFSSLSIYIGLDKKCLTTLAINLGFALSLEPESSGVWMNAGAIALHKFVISFSVGVELISNKVSITLENRISIKMEIPDISNILYSG